MKLNIKIAAVVLTLFSLNLYAQTSFVADATDARNQATFDSDAPLEKIVGLASGLEAMVMLDPNDITKTPRGKVKVAIDKIKTGIDLRDEHLRSEDWLNSKKYPYAEFELTGISNPGTKQLKDGQKITVTLQGKFSVHGVTKNITAPAELFYLKESDKTKSRLPGNLLRVTSNFSIKLSDYGIKIPEMVVGKVNEEVKIAVNFVASDKNAMSGNPCAVCNPCAVEKGKCNPCAMKDMKKGQCNPCAMKK